MCQVHDPRPSHRISIGKKSFSLPQPFSFLETKHTEPLGRLGCFHRKMPIRLALSTQPLGVCPHLLSQGEFPGEYQCLISTFGCQGLLVNSVQAATDHHIQILGQSHSSSWWQYYLLLETEISLVSMTTVSAMEPEEQVNKEGGRL